MPVKETYNRNSLILSVALLIITHSEGTTLREPRLELVPEARDYGAVLNLYNPERISNESLTEESINCTLSPQHSEIELKSRSSPTKWRARDVLGDSLLQTKTSFEVAYNGEGNLTCSFVQRKDLVSNTLLLRFKNTVTIVLQFVQAPVFVIKHTLKDFNRLLSPTEKMTYYFQQNEGKEVVARVTFPTATDEFEGNDWIPRVSKLVDCLTKSKKFTLRYCRSTRYCRPEKEGDFSWPKTPAGRSAAPENPCLDVNGAPTPIRRCLGDFFQGVYWEEAPKVPESCSEATSRTQHLRNISAEMEKEDSFGKLLTTIRGWPPLNAHEISLVSKALEGAVAEIDNSSADPNAQPNVSSIVEVMDAVLRSGSEVVRNADKASGSSEAILNSIERLLVAEASSSPKVIYGSSFSAFTVDGTSGVRGFAAVGERSSSSMQTIDPLWQKNLSRIHQVGATVAAILLTDDEGIGLTSCVYYDTGLFDGDDVGRRLLSPVVGLTLIRENKTSIESPIVALLLFSRGAENHSPVCSFWDTSTGRGKWSDVGCALTSGDLVPSDMYGCLCTHLTNFALLISFHDYDDDPILNVITVVGCSVSLVCIALSFLFAALNPQWLRSVYRKIELNLFASVALLDATELAVATIEVSKEREFRVACIALGALLHYSVLATFTWMMVVAALHFLRLSPKTLMDARRRAGTHLLLKASVFGWGVAAIPVVATLSVGPNLYVRRSQTAFCYPRDDAFYAGVLFPVALAIFINTSIFIWIVGTLFCMRSIPSSQRDTWTRQMVRRIFFSLFLFCLLGLNWIVGLFLEPSKSSEEANKFFGYVFCTTATLHGVSLFVFLVVCEKSVRNRLRRIVTLFSQNMRQNSSSVTRGTTITLTASGNTTVINERSSYPTYSVIDNAVRESEAVPDCC